MTPCPPPRQKIALSIKGTLFARFYAVPLFKPSHISHYGSLEILRLEIKKHLIHILVLNEKCFTPALPIMR